MSESENMSQQRFCDTVGLDQGRWSKIINGKRNTKYENALKIARILDTEFTLWIRTETEVKVLKAQRTAAWERYKQLVAA